MDPKKRHYAQNLLPLNLAHQPPRLLIGLMLVILSQAACQPLQCLPETLATATAAARFGWRTLAI
jgi:hypothetical protein